MYDEFRLRQVDVKAEHFERQVTRIESERDTWEKKYEEAAEAHNISKRELEEVSHLPNSWSRSKSQINRRWSSLHSLLSKWKRFKSKTTGLFLFFLFFLLLGRSPCFAMSPHLVHMRSICFPSPDQEYRHQTIKIGKGWDKSKLSGIQLLLFCDHLDLSASSHLLESIIICWVVVGSEH